MRIVAPNGQPASGPHGLRSDFFVQVAPQEVMLAELKLHFAPHAKEHTSLEIELELAKLE